MQSVHSYLHGRIHGDDEELQSSVSGRDQKETLAEKTHRTVTATASAGRKQEDELCHILEQTVKDLVALFYSSQVQVCEHV